MKLHSDKYYAEWAVSARVFIKVSQVKMAKEYTY